MDRATSAFVGDIPRYYDEYLGPNIFDHYGRDMATRLAAEGATEVLELAAGSGIVTRHIRDTLPAEARIMATDLNDAMLEVARAKFSPDENVDFRQADAMELPFDSAAFDSVAAQFGHMFFPDRGRAHAEAMRVLKPGGLYVFSTWGAMAENPFSEITLATMNRIFADDPPIFYRVPFSLHDPAPVLGELEAAGFSDIAHEALPHRQKVADLGLFAHGLIFGNPAIDEVRNRAGDPEAVRDEVAAGLRARFGDEPAEMPLLAHVFSARVR